MKRLYALGLAVLSLVIIAAFTTVDVNELDKWDDQALQIEELVPTGEKVHVCHLTGHISDGAVKNYKGDDIPAGEAVGVVIVVSENAVPAHCDHGDKVLRSDLEFDHGFCRPDQNPGNRCPDL